MTAAFREWLCTKLMIFAFDVGADYWSDAELTAWAVFVRLRFARKDPAAYARRFGEPKA